MMDTNERLMAIEEIKQAKAWYFYGLDHRDWDIWRDRVWTSDARLEVPEADMVVEPLDTLIAWVAESTADQVSVHHGHTPIIEFVSDQRPRSSGRWKTAYTAASATLSRATCGISMASDIITRRTFARTGAGGCALRD